MRHVAGAVSPPWNQDPAWRSLYRLGAVAAALSVVMYIVALILFAVTPAPPTGGGAAMLEYVAANRAVYIVKQILWLVPSVLMIILFLALAVALWHLDQVFALIAGVIGVAAWAGAFAWPATGDGSLVFIMLSDDFVAASAADRAPFIGAAETLIAFNDVPAPLGVIQTVSVLLIALLMLRGVFSPGVAWLGVATGVVGTVSEALRPWLGAIYAGYGLLLFVWMIWISWELWRLGRTDPESVTEPARLI